MLKNQRFIIKTRCKVTNFYFNICYFLAFFFVKTAKNIFLSTKRQLLPTSKNIFQPMASQKMFYNIKCRIGRPTPYLLLY